MRLRELSLSNFRSCRDTTVSSQENLTVLVGENGSGKSNIIDALRLVTTPSSGRRFFYFDTERDLNRSLSLGSSVAVRQTFSDLTEIEKAIFVPHLVDKHEDLVYTTRFSTDPSLPRRSQVGHFVGESQILDPEPENRERISCVYLPPLRDAVRELDSTDGNRLSEIMHALGTQEELQCFKDAGNEALRALADDDLPIKTIGAVQEHLTSITHPARGQRIGIDYRMQDTARLARLLRIQMGEFGVDPGDLAASDLGYANLLYIATVVIELERAAEYDLTLMLVEEPEAHLHPQLQSVLLSYLEARAGKSAHAANAKSDPSPSGRIQVMVSTHSPNLASSVSTRSVVVVKQMLRSIDATTEVCETGTIPLAAIDMAPAERRKVDRYLNVTRSALLFARQVILVEGLAESLLIRTLAEQCVLRPEPGESDAQRMQREQYRAISVIAVDSVDFLPYLKILLAGSQPLVERVVVITDADGDAGQRRKESYDAAFKPQVDNGTLTVCVGMTTLEADLFSDPANEPVLRQAYLEMHPRSGDKWNNVVQSAPVEPDRRAKHFYDAMDNGDIDIGKGDFAHLIAEALGADRQASVFNVPEYLSRAIRAALVPVPAVSVAAVAP